MLLITDNLLVKYLEANEKLKLDEFLNKKLFKVSDTPLTYRQVNALGEDKLLSTDRETKQSWRKFSFKELVYILIVRELKKFGLKHEQLKFLWQAFFKEPVKQKINKISINKFIGECATGCTFGQVEIKIAIDTNGNVIFYDPFHSIFLDTISGSKTLITIRLNDMVNTLLKQMGKKSIPLTWTQDKLVFDTIPDISLKEKELLKIIRNKNFSVIKIKKKDGDIAVVYAEKILDSSKGLNQTDLIKTINDKDYQDINIIKRDGKIVNFKVEETIKF